MDTQTLMPGSSGPFSSNTGGSGGRSPMLLILVVLLGLGTIVFGVLSITFSSKASGSAKALQTQKIAAATAARDDQKAIDDDLNAKAKESPYRAYNAPQEFGSFVINFPKSWSSTVDQESHGVQVDLILNPDFIRKTFGQNETVATHIQFIERGSDDFLSQYTNAIKYGKIKQTNITVSQQPAFDITGDFGDHKTVREVVVPIRDKVLVFTSENSKYASEFSQILAQSKIIP